MADPNGAAAGVAFLAENKLNDGVITLQSGLQYKVLEEVTRAVLPFTAFSPLHPPDHAPPGFLGWWTRAPDSLHAV